MGSFGAGVSFARYDLSNLIIYPTINLVKASRLDGGRFLSFAFAMRSMLDPLHSKSRKARMEYSAGTKLLYNSRAGLDC